MQPLLYRQADEYMYITTGGERHNNVLLLSDVHRSRLRSRLLQVLPHAVQVRAVHHGRKLVD